MENPLISPAGQIKTLASFTELLTKEPYVDTYWTAMPSHVVITPLCVRLVCPKQKANRKS